MAQARWAPSDLQASGRLESSRVLYSLSARNSTDSSRLNTLPVFGSVRPILAVILADR